MSQKEKTITQLLIKYLNGKCSVKEIRKLNNWIMENEENRNLFKKFLNPEILQQDLDLLNSFDGETAWQKRFNQNKSLKQKHNLKWLAAACIILIGCLSLFHFNYSLFPISQTSHFADRKEVNDNDRKPALIGAELKFQNGESIVLNNPVKLNATGEIIDEANNIAIDHSFPKDKIEWLEIKVPIAQYYNLTLPDSTLVTLNSNSTIKFPSKFIEKNREVFVEGEAFFDVKNNQNQLFIVNTNQANIQVLGTSFNVNNYNEKLITTLEKGKVNVQSKNDSRILKPSQKAIVKDNSIEILDANILKDLAWKNKKFHFENDRLEEILFQIQNWYGVKTDYKKFKNHQETFSGTINRDVNLSQFLEMLSKTSDYNFSIQNNHLIIHNKHI